MPPVRTHTQPWFQNPNKSSRRAGFHHGDHYSYKSHITLYEFNVKFWDVQVQGGAVLLEPSCQAHLCFYSKASSEEGAAVPRAGVMGVRALDHGSLSPWTWHSSPLLQWEALPSSCLLGSICRSAATARTGTCSVESWAASCGLGQKPRGLVWGEGWSDRDMAQAAQSSLYSRHKTKKLSGSSELPHLF